jgi:uncharacterized protein with PIN domain
MSEEATETEQTVQTETETTDTEQESALDLEAAAEYEARIDALEAQAAEQREEIERLNGLLLDLSTRVADGNDIGVCPDCNGPLERISRLFRTDTIECTDCGRVVYSY